MFPKIVDFFMWKLWNFMIFYQNQWKTKENHWFPLFFNGFPLFFIDFDQKSWKILIFNQILFFIFVFVFCFFLFLIINTFSKLGKNIINEFPMKFCVDTGTTGSLDCENNPEPLQLTDSHYFSRDCLALKKTLLYIYKIIL